MSLLRKKQKAAAVIVAAGSSTRMGGIDKLTAELCGKTVRGRTFAAFEQAGELRAIIKETR